MIDEPFKNFIKWENGEEEYNFFSKIKKGLLKIYQKIKKNTKSLKNKSKKN